MTGYMQWKQVGRTSVHVTIHHNSSPKRNKGSKARNKQIPASITSPSSFAGTLYSTDATHPPTASPASSIPILQHHAPPIPTPHFDPDPRGEKMEQKETDPKSNPVRNPNQCQLENRPSHLPPKEKKKRVAQMLCRNIVQDVRPRGIIEEAKATVRPGTPMLPTP